MESAIGAHSLTRDTFLLRSQDYIAFCSVAPIGSLQGESRG